MSLHAAQAEAPRRMPIPIHSARFEDGELTLVLAGEGETRPLLLLDEPDDVGTKLRVAALVMRKLSAEERAALAYLDVTLPDRPVASINPLPSGGGLGYSRIFPANTGLTYSGSGRTLRRTLKMSLRKEERKSR